ncbi:MAG: hypothetical protein PHW62_00360 [Candidatus Ratteibacteria bacterium]|nr:hypothetical protein [Candidatus Ratteibacteria bacterium]
MKDNTFPVIQLYSPDVWHDEQAMVMNEEGRKKLIEALQSGATKVVIPAFVNDGEGYYLCIHVIPDKEIEKFKSPYTDEMCRNLFGEAEKEEPKYSATSGEHRLIEQGKDAGEGKMNPNATVSRILYFWLYLAAITVSYMSSSAKIIFFVLALAMGLLFVQELLKTGGS